MCKTISQYLATDDTFDFTINPAINGITEFSITTTGGTGCYEILNVPPGDYTITELPLGGWTGVPPNPQVATVVADQTTTVTFVNQYNCMFTKGVSLRYRNMSRTVTGPQEIFMGAGDIGSIPANSVRTHYTWNVSTTTLKNYPFEFRFDPTAPNKLTQGISGGIGATASFYPSVPPLTDGSGNFTYCTNGTCTTTQTVNMANMNMFEVIVSNRGNPPAGTVVSLCDLVLTTNAGTYPVLNNGATCFAPNVNQQIIVQYAWPADGSNPFQGFTFTGTIQLRGVPGSDEFSKVEIGIGDCPDASTLVQLI